MANPEVRESPERVDNIKTAVAGNRLFYWNQHRRALLSHKSGNCFVAVLGKSGSRQVIVVLLKRPSSRRTNRTRH